MLWTGMLSVDWCLCVTVTSVLPIRVDSGTQDADDQREMDSLNYSHINDESAKRAQYATVQLQQHHTATTINNDTS